MRWPRVLVLGFVVLLCISAPTSRGALAAETWSEIKHIQVLEGPETIWVFVEVVRITDYSGNLFLDLMSKHPDEEVASRTAITIDRAGKLTRTGIAKDQSPSFDPDLNPIFRLSDGFYQYSHEAAGQPASVYRWRGDRFSPLDEREAREVQEKLRRVRQADSLDQLFELEAITEREGWRNLYLHALHAFVEKEGRLPRGDAPGPVEYDPYVSNRHQIQIRIRGNDALPGWRSLRLSAVVASSLSKTEPWSRTLIEADTRGERVRRKSPSRR